MTIQAETRSGDREPGPQTGLAQTSERARRTGVGGERTGVGGGRTGVGGERTGVGGGSTGVARERA